MNSKLLETVGRLVAQNPARARVFEKHRIDYCCGGKLPLGDACERRKVSAEEILAELESCDAARDDGAGTDWTQVPLTELADHIVATHHDYLRGELPRLEMMAARVAKVHGDHAPDTIELHQVFAALRRELEEHTMKEEEILFPWIRRMERGGGPAGPMAPSVANPIRCMEQEHDAAGAALEKMRALTNDFTPPADACNTWRVLYAALDGLEQDMHTHIHKENSILFPRALQLEEACV
ncbi:MAG: iron-sulfur cluster repair di-iron protein [Sumerlaeia bacterium]